ncbi:Thioredoxin [Myxococcus hansupus]|uniref:Thioredoxin n=1 Tax=Pseudomyxococcus hansupus TaxID=1297742 RepID=A0A0H4X1Z9_9BACT|nr:thioredoxin domain-containing protein [Myxococcus hansupus]AKQ67883.1 Thioredoxin [Myxococcus hansupus]
MAGQTVELTQENFDRITQGAGVCVVDFWAEWCGPCRNFAPTFEATAKEFPAITFGKLDTEAQEAISGRMEIRSIPTLVAFKDGVEVRRASGAMSASAFTTWVSKLGTVDLAVEAQRAKNRKLTEEGTPPLGVSPHAEWDEGDQEWCFGDKDEDGEKHGPWKYWRADGTLCNECIFVHGKPQGPFKRFHESGEVSQDGAFEKGNLHGPRTWYASDQFTTERMHENGVCEKVRRTVMVYSHGRVTQVLHYNGEGERVVPSTGVPYPSRPASLPEKAEYREDLDQWSLVSLNAAGERHGLAQFWDRDGDLVWEGEFQEGSRHGRYHSSAEGEYADPRVEFDEGEMADGFACGTWKLLDADRKVVATRDLGVAQDHETLDASEVFSNLPRSAEAWREFAEQARADRRYREALLAMARASAVSLDVAPLKAWLEALTLPRSESSAREHADGVMNGASDERAALADALVRGAEPATLLRGLAVLHDQADWPRAGLDFILAAMLLAPERPAYLFTRSLILANLGLGEQMRKDAEAIAPYEPDSEKFLSAYARVLFPRFDFWAGREPASCTFTEVPDAPSKELDAVQVVVRKYATRLQLLRAEILSRFKPGADVPWLPPDVSSLLPDGPVELEETETEDSDGDAVPIDETLSTKGMGLPALSRAVRGEWSALVWLLWACGEQAVRMPDAVSPPADFGQAAGQATQRLWQCRNRRTRGRLDPDLPTFDFEGVALQELHPNLAGIAEEQYAEMQAMFFWLTEADHVSPWQANLRG